MKILTYKGHPVINLDQVCYFHISHENLVQGRYRDHYITFVFHDNRTLWKMETEEEADSIHAEIVNGILGGNEHIILGGN